MKRTTDQIDIDRFVALWEDDVHTDRMAEILGVRRERLMQLARKMKLRRRDASTMRSASRQPADPTPEEIEQGVREVQAMWTVADERAARGVPAHYEVPRVRVT